MVYLTPVSSRKRPAPTAQSPMSKSSLRNTNIEMANENPYLPPKSIASNSGHTTGPASKRQRLSFSTSIVKGGINRQQNLPTPPKSPPQVNYQTMALKVTIPRRQLSQQEQRTLKTRIAAAERWKPKLTRPLPLRSEITKAYPLKLLRHYPGHGSFTEANFVKPKIDRSPRVEKLLREFPILHTATIEAVVGSKVQPRLLTPAEQRDMDSLQANKKITESEFVLKLAWENFAISELDREDRGREAMLLSGLWTDDLIREMKGQKNRLPEWKKLITGKFA